MLKSNSAHVYLRSSVRQNDDTVLAKFQFKLRNCQLFPAAGPVPSMHEQMIRQVLQVRFWQFVPCANT